MENYKGDRDNILLDCSSKVIGGKKENNKLLFCSREIDIKHKGIVTENW